MPTYEQTTAFLRDFDRLTRAQQEQFIAAVYLFIADIVAMDAGQIDRFRPGLRVKGVQGEPGLFEMTWARNGRATFFGVLRSRRANGMWFGCAAAPTASSHDSAQLEKGGPEGVLKKCDTFPFRM